MPLHSTAPKRKMNRHDRGSSPIFTHRLPLKYGRFRTSIRQLLYRKPIDHQPATATATRPAHPLQPQSQATVSHNSHTARATDHGIAPSLARPPRPHAQLPPHPRHLSTFPDNKPAARDTRGRVTHARAETRRRVQRRVCSSLSLWPVLSSTPGGWRAALNAVLLGNAQDVSPCVMDVVDYYAETDD